MLLIGYGALTAQLMMIARAKQTRVIIPVMGPNIISVGTVVVCVVVGVIVVCIGQVGAGNLAKHCCCDIGT